MALKGLDIFKLTPKTNCKDCGNPTCMAFAMKLYVYLFPIEKCPHMSAEALSTLSEATAPPMKTFKVGELSLGGETVLSVTRRPWSPRRCTLWPCATAWTRPSRTL